MRAFVNQNPATKSIVKKIDKALDAMIEGISKDLNELFSKEK